MWDEKRAEAMRATWMADPFTTGTVVRHKASGVTMVVIERAQYPKDRICAWMTDNSRYQDDFHLCELERVEDLQKPTEK